MRFVSFSRIGRIERVRILYAAAVALVLAQASGRDVARPATGGVLLPIAQKPLKLPRPLAGRYLDATLSQSDTTAAPGTRLALIVDVVPKPKMHVYAPEQTGGYIRIELTLDPDAAIKIEPAALPKASNYYFEPLKETFKVYDKPFRIRQDLSIALTADVRRRAAAKEPLAITGTLRYQACDDQVCYRPETLPVSWTIGLQPLVSR